MIVGRGLMSRSFLASSRSARAPGVVLMTETFPECASSAALRQLPVRFWAVANGLRAALCQPLTTHAFMQLSNFSGRTSLARADRAAADVYIAAEVCNQLPASDGRAI
jgi:hypothetical protein